MGIFGRNYEKPGPGVKKDEPRKTGSARFFELLYREFWDLVKLNLLLCICAIPSVAMFIISLLSANWLIPLTLAVILAFPMGGALTACVYYITKIMRDDPSYVWYEFKRKFLENFKQSAIVGILCAAFIYTQIFLWRAIILSEGEAELIIFFSILFSLLIFSMITPYIFMHFAYIELRTFGILKNSILMTFAYLPRSFMGAMLGGMMWIIIAMLFPASMIAVPIVVIFGVTLSMFICLSWVWKPFDTSFKIEETLIKRQEKE